jgi:hypothetical protein
MRRRRPRGRCRRGRRHRKPRRWVGGARGAGRAGRRATRSGTGMAETGRGETRRRNGVRRGTPDRNWPRRPRPDHGCAVGPEAQTGRERRSEPPGEHRTAAAGAPGGRFSAASPRLRGQVSSRPWCRAREARRLARCARRRAASRRRAFAPVRWRAPRRAECRSARTVDGPGCRWGARAGSRPADPPSRPPPSSSQPPGRGLVRTPPPTAARPWTTQSAGPSDGQRPC